MEPKLPGANNGPERFPGNYGQNNEQVPQPATPEVGIQGGAERVEQRGEAAPAAAHSAPALPPIQITTTPVIAPVVDDTSVQPASDLPVAANDDDLIEKEWVDQAKKIIIQTKDDPYRREQEVNRLQADYLRKRYGKELGVSQ